MRATTPANSGLSLFTSSATAFSRSPSGASIIRLFSVACSRSSAKVFSVMGFPLAIRQAATIDSAGLRSLAGAVAGLVNGSQSALRSIFMTADATAVRSRPATPNS